MSNVVMLQNLSTLVSTIATMFKGVPAGAGLVISTTNTKGMQFADGVPISLFPVVTNAAEVTTARASYNQYIDVRDLTFWNKSGSTWSSVPYTGQSGAWRKNGLIKSNISGRMWYLDFNTTAHEADLDP